MRRTISICRAPNAPSPRRCRSQVQRTNVLASPAYNYGRRGASRAGAALDERRHKGRKHHVDAVADHIQYLAAGHRPDFNNLIEEHGELDVQRHAMCCLWMMEQGKAHNSARVVHRVAETQLECATRYAERLATDCSTFPRG